MLPLKSLSIAQGTSRPGHMDMSHIRHQSECLFTRVSDQISLDQIKSNQIILQRIKLEWNKDLILAEQFRF